MFRASSAHLQEDIVVYKQHMVPSLSIRVPGGLLIRSYRENWIFLAEDRDKCGTVVNAVMNLRLSQNAEKCDRLRTCEFRQKESVSLG